MARPLTAPKPDLAVLRFRGGVRAVVLWCTGGLCALLLIAATGLWFHYGTAMFFETIAAGFANCF